MANYENFKSKALAEPVARIGYERRKATESAAQLVKHWRAEAHLSQEQLAQIVGKSQESISRIESASGPLGPHIETLSVIAEACDFDLVIVGKKKEGVSSNAEPIDAQAAHQI